MGIRTKLTVFKKVDDLKRTDGRKREEDQRRNWRNSEEERRWTCRTPKKTVGEWVSKKEYWTTKRNRESRTGKRTQRKRSRKTETGNRKE